MDKFNGDKSTDYPADPITAGCRAKYPGVMEMWKYTQISYEQRRE
ncbi:hypothetical protein [Endozoicomonas sp. ALE010]